MTIDEAAKILREMYDHGATKSEAATFVHLLGIKYADQIDGMSLPELAARAGISVNYKTEMHKGRKLAKYVTVNF